MNTHTNTHDPSFDARQPSTLLADLVVGTFDFDGLDHEARIIKIHAINTMYRAVMTCGELEHTSDWDWRIFVVWGEAGLIAGTLPTTGDEGETMCDTITLAYEVEPNDYLDRFSRWAYLTVEQISPDGDATDVLVPIDQIHTITIEEA